MLNRNDVFCPNDQQLQAVFNKIAKMQYRETLHVKDVAPNIPDVWIHCAKMYIDCFKDAEFNSDYTVLKKLINFDFAVKM